MNKIVIESCVDNLNDSLINIDKGANRLEYCASLDQDGLTPPMNEIKTLIRKTNVPIRVMIRPSNTFLISVDEMKIMIKSIKEFTQLPIQGIVFGMLNNQNRIDFDQLEQLISVSNNMPITFHKAIDASSNILKDVALLNHFPQIDHILSSGGKTTAWEGRDILIKMNKIFNNDIIAAGSISAANFQKHQEYLNFSAYHGKKIV